MLNPLKVVYGLVKNIIVQRLPKAVILVGKVGTKVLLVPLRVGRRFGFKPIADFFRSRPNVDMPYFPFPVPSAPNLPNFPNNPGNPIIIIIQTFISHTTPLGAIFEGILGALLLVITAKIVYSLLKLPFIRNTPQIKPFVFPKIEDFLPFLPLPITWSNTIFAFSLGVIAWTFVQDGGLKNLLMFIANKFPSKKLKAITFTLPFIEINDFKNVKEGGKKRRSR